MNAVGTVIDFTGALRAGYFSPSHTHTRAPLRVRATSSILNRARDGGEKFSGGAASDPAANFREKSKKCAGAPLLDVECAKGAAPLSSKASALVSKLSSLDGA